MGFIQKVMVVVNANLQGQHVEWKYAGYRSWYNDDSYKLIKNWCFRMNNLSTYKFSKRICKKLGIKPSEVVIIQKAWRDTIRVIYLKNNEKAGKEVRIQFDDNDKIHYSDVKVLA